uniref:Pre-rRNA-processing protein TSR2 homolog n=1 Tax=Accipiter nisus TaxID=211598 RepID=A0A8B9NGN1_9AVES
MAAPGLEEGGLFARGVRAVLGGWAALQLAVAHGFGGPQSPEKATWLAGALQEFFAQNAELREEEVEEFLAEVMDNEFDTATSLNQYAPVCSQSPLVAPTEGGETLPWDEGAAMMSLSWGGEPLTLMVSPKGGRGRLMMSFDTPMMSFPPQAMECGTPPPPPDGWTLVRRRRR